MKNAVLVYAGTTEGRRLACALAGAGVHTTVCVATGYGEQVLEPHPLLEVRVGRQSEEEMRALFSEGRFAAVVDATHPFALRVSEQLKRCAGELSVPRFQLRRDTGADGEDRAGVRFFSSAGECARELSHTSGNILLTTGSKELRIYAADPSVARRLYVRVLPGRESLALCEEAGLVGKQILAMQGPFSRELNLALIHQYNIECLVTKESGRTGGLPEKLEAAEEAGIRVFLIGNPETEAGEPLPAVLERLSALLGVPIALPRRRITLVGAGMGADGGMTKEAEQVIATARYLFGAKRLLEPYAGQKETRAAYLAEEIIPCLRELDAQDGGAGEVAVLFSGDTGFYSGAEKLLEKLRASGYENVRVLPGISSVSALAARAGVPWQDAELISLHGRPAACWEAQVPETVRRKAKTILLLSGRAQVSRLCGLLEEAGLAHCRLLLGMQLSYPAERVDEGTVAEWREKLPDWPEDGLYTAMVRNDAPEPPRISYGWGEEQFVRGRVPMTKEEVRSIVLSKLRLTTPAVVYDIGSGTGSVAVEIAALSHELEVYALECKEEACALTEENKKRHHLRNLHVISGMAPESMTGLPAPRFVFIGGSGGRLVDILRVLYEKSPKARVVITAVSLETVAELAGLEQIVPLKDFELVQVQVARARACGEHRLMQGENPVTVCAFSFREDGGR